jgi:putative transposase
VFEVPLITAVCQGGDDAGIDRFLGQIGVSPPLSTLIDRSRKNQYNHSMARPYRLQAEHCLYHIMSRGDDRKRIYTIPSDYGKFMDYVMKAKERYQFCLYAYCLMANHFHLLVETVLPNISKIMHYIKGSYTTYYNIRHRCTGHLFQGRFKSIVVDKDAYFLELTRYIHLNPVYAGIVPDPGAYQWSSYHGYLGKKDEYIDKDEMKQYLGMTRGQYQRFVLDGIKKRKDPLKKVYAGFLLGSVGFIKDKLQDLEIQITSDDVAHKRMLRDDIEVAEEIIKEVTEYYKTTIEEMKKSMNRPMHAKHVLVYLLRRLTGLSNREIGRYVGMRPAAVSRAGISIEQRLNENKNMKRAVNKIVLKVEG